MPFRQTIEACFSDSVGEAGLARADFTARLFAAEGAVNRLRSRHADGSLPLLQIPHMREDLPPLIELVHHLRNLFSDFVVFGTGGSALGARALAALAAPAQFTPPGQRRLHVIDNIDAQQMGQALSALDFQTTCFLVISKSGGTAETLAQFVLALDAVRRSLGDEAIRSRFIVVTEPTDNVLRRMAEKWGLTVLDHHTGIGGRYSVLTNVGLLPALVAGLSVNAVRDGAAAALDNFLTAKRMEDNDAAVGAVLSVAFDQVKKISATVVYPYLERLGYFAQWHRQLWAESLGKGGLGTTPIPATGPVDQHSQLQLYLNGPADKLYNLFRLEQAEDMLRIDPDLAFDPALDYLAGHSLGQLVHAEAVATEQTLIRNRRPVRLFTFDKVGEFELGQLFMHFMLETILAADLMGVDPFDQPAVEEGKILTRQYLRDAPQSTAD